MRSVGRGPWVPRGDGGSCSGMPRPQEASPGLAWSELGRSSRSGWVSGHWGPLDSSWTPPGPVQPQAQPSSPPCSSWAVEGWAGRGQVGRWPDSLGFLFPALATACGAFLPLQQMVKEQW